MANLSTIIANRGYYYRPHILKKVGDSINQNKKYTKRLKEETPLGSTGYFTFYYLALYIFGQRACDQMIRLVKKVFGSTPEL